MGTESEALRWKQWIDRWIKISAPTNSIPSSTSSSKIDPNSSSGPGQRKSLLTTEQLRYQLINMEGDPVFCEGLCREILNNNSHFRLAIKCLSGVDTSEKARGFFCQIIFYLCKCPSPSVRKLLLSLLPALLFSHLINYSIDEGDDEKEEDEEANGIEECSSLNSIEIALLALYQADMNYQPEPLNVRVPSLQSNSLYHSSLKASDTFPLNVNPSLIHAPLHLYPTSPILKLTDYTRCIVYYRLCRSFQDFMPIVPEMALIIYSFWIERCAVGGTVLEDLESIDLLFTTLINLSENNHPSSASMLASTSTNTLSTFHSHSQYIKSATASTRQIEAEDWKFVNSLVLKAASLKIRTASHEELMLLWTDCVPFVLARYVSIGDLLRKHIFNRARMELLPQIVMALE